MKRVFAVLLMIALCACMFGLVASAETVDTEQTSDAIPAPDADMTDTTETENVTEEVDFFDRLIEMIDEGKIYELATLVASAVFIALAYLLKKAIGNFSTKITGFGNKISDKLKEGSEGTSKALSDGVTALTAFVTDSESRLNDMIAVNEQKVYQMVENAGVNIDIFKKAIEDKMDELSVQIEQKLATTMHETKKAEQILVDVAKILDVVYMGSSTIPAVTKERVMEIYDHAEKTMRTEESTDDAAV